MEIFRSNIWEIKKSGALKTLGGLLALFHIAQFYFWNTDGRLPLKLVQQGLPMCWSFMENCAWLHAIPFGLLTFIYYTYLVLIGIAACLLLLTEWVALGYWFLTLGTFLGLTLYFQDLRLSSNEGYLIFLFSLAYLFIPSKHRLMRRLVISFFVAHGLSEAAADWLSGIWYMDHLHAPVKLAEWLAAMSVLVQMIGAGAMLFRDGRYFWTGWLTLFFYTCSHVYMGDMLASCLAIGSLLYLAFDELELRKAEREYIYQSFIRPEPSFLWGGLLLLVFWSAQLMPFVSMARESRVRKALSVWTLHPEAANEDCDQTTFAIYNNRVEEIEITPQLSRQPAMFCNPYLRYLDLKGMCKVLKEKEADFVTLSSALNIRNFRDKTSYRAFEVQDFCNPSLTYRNAGEVQWTMNPEK